VPAPPQARTRPLTIIAQDPSVKADGRILTATVDVPAEELAPGPWGARVHVIDYDASTRTLYKPRKYPGGKGGVPDDPFAGADDRALLADPTFHAQNVYAIVMATLARFERALGRRVSWSFQGHQLKVAPHAFADANAFYSRPDEALLFGYFPGRGGKTVFSCLAHDVVAHETTHALLDGLRERYTDPSSPDQAAFHEGFADVVAVLSVFALRPVVAALLDRRRGRTVRRAHVRPRVLRKSVLLQLGKEMGAELSAVRDRPLRESATLPPSADYLRPDNAEYQEPHRRGQVLVAAMLDAFIRVWAGRLEALGRTALNRDRVVEEGANAADYLLTMAVRALDYSVPVHMEFADFLSALLTADHEIRPDDSTYHFRDHLRASFAAYGVRPSSPGRDGEAGLWLHPKKKPRHDRTHFEAMQRDPDEVFRFIWENRVALDLADDCYSRVLSVRPCLRIGPDGFALRETVAEYMQVLDVEARELGGLGIEKPADMPADTPVRLHGGATLIFDEYGRLKFSINNKLRHPRRQTERLGYLWRYGHFSRGASFQRRFSHLHRLRALNHSFQIWERWT
jgi:hypothetical protein